MITSSVLNAITFKPYAAVAFQNPRHTLHNDQRHANFKTIIYCQKFQSGQTVRIQFTSDDEATMPELKIFEYGTDKELLDYNGVLNSFVIGTVNRAFFNFDLTFVPSIENKMLRLEVTQGTDKLISEAVIVSDFTEQIQRGELMKIEYSNIDRNNSDLSDYWVNWGVRDTMEFLVEAVMFEPSLEDEVEVLKGVQSETIVSAVLYNGFTFQTAALPQYMILKLAAASSLDLFVVNDIQYVKRGAVSTERFGTSTSYQLSVQLTEKHNIGLNVDDLGIPKTPQTDMPIIVKQNTAVTGAGWIIDNPKGYMLHAIWVTHTAASAANTATVKVGVTNGGDEVIDAIQGVVKKADYSLTNSTWKTFTRHFIRDIYSQIPLFVSVDGVGAIMHIIAHFETIEETVNTP